MGAGMGAEPVRRHEDAAQQVAAGDASLFRLSEEQVVEGQRDQGTDALRT